MVRIRGWVIDVGDQIVRAKAIRADDHSLVFDLSGEVSLLQVKPQQSSVNVMKDTSSSVVGYPKTTRYMTKPTTNF